MNGENKICPFIRNVQEVTPIDDKETLVWRLMKKFTPMIFGLGSFRVTTDVYPITDFIRYTPRRL